MTKPIGLYGCPEHGFTAAINTKGYGYFGYCPICELKQAKHERDLAFEEIGLLKGAIETMKEKEQSSNTEDPTKQDKEHCNCAVCCEVRGWQNE